jgi:Ca-activated chloride channel family protein
MPAMPAPVLEPTKCRSGQDPRRSTICCAGRLDGRRGGHREAYRLAEQSFQKDGVNRVMLATDGDFNVGQTDDDDLKRMIEEKRKSGVFLSVFGFGRGNLNDRMMQTHRAERQRHGRLYRHARRGEKTLVEDASSTLFPIAKDVKIQVEFNPAKVAEYRLIGYETRALNREDFNNDASMPARSARAIRVTAIYEITPKGSPAAGAEPEQVKRRAISPASGDDRHASRGPDR